MAGIGIDKAMILAAGFGTRLLPLTENLPKALVEHHGQPMIKNVIDKLISYGIKEIVVNVHHHAELLKKYFDENTFHVKIHLIAEEKIFGTGGGIKNARQFLESTENFFVYNADVSSGIDLKEMTKQHMANDSIATVATNMRITTRPLLFDENNILNGRIINNKEFFFSTSKSVSVKKAFCGIHIISSGIFNTFPEEQSFDIVDHYMELVSKGFQIRSYDIGNVFWKDLGKLADLQ